MPTEASTTPTVAQTVFPSLVYEDADSALAWLVHAFGLRPGLRVAGADGGIVHAELHTENGAVVMVLSTQHSTRRDRSPRSLGGTAQSVYVVTSDVDAQYARAVAAGADVFNPLRDAGHGREFCCYDLEGHIWTFGTYSPARA